MDVHAAFRVFRDGSPVNQPPGITVVALIPFTSVNGDLAEWAVETAGESFVFICCAFNGELKEARERAIEIMAFVFMACTLVFQAAPILS